MLVGAAIPLLAAPLLVHVGLRGIGKDDFRSGWGFASWVLTGLIWAVSLVIGSPAGALAGGATGAWIARRAATRK